MELSGLNMQIRLGSRLVLRCPRCEITSRRHDPVSMALLVLPDTDGSLYRSIAAGETLSISYGYRGQDRAEWSGTVKWTRRDGRKDQIEIGAVDGAKPLLDTRITQSFEEETPTTIIRWALNRTGLAIGRIDPQEYVLPRFVAADLPVWQLVRQVVYSCHRAFDSDLRRWALWLGAGGVNFGDFDESGSVPIIATAAGLISHRPTEDITGLGEVETFLLPGMSHSRLFRLQDVRRGIDATYRALCVQHIIEPNKIRTYLNYGVERGWSL